MATKPLTSEAIALTEKKMDMALDDIIQMSKTKASKSRKQRPLNKNRKIFNVNQDKSRKIRQYMDSRSTLRQGVLAQRRSSFQGNNFPLPSESARKAALAPFRNKTFNRNRAVNWNRPRTGGSLTRPGNSLNGGKALKRQQQQQQQQPVQKGETMLNQKPKTLDSLFANMREQRMRGFTRTNNGLTRTNNGSAGRGRGVGNQPIQPWLRARFGNYRS